jgi:hypothetical protein
VQGIRSEDVDLIDDGREFVVSARGVHSVLELYTLYQFRYILSLNMDQNSS